VSSVIVKPQDDPLRHCVPDGSLSASMISVGCWFVLMVVENRASGRHGVTTAVVVVVGFLCACAKSSWGPQLISMNWDLGVV
jgi:hypothetical protein